MDSGNAEHRRYRRVYFQRDQEVTGILARFGLQAEDLRIKVLNLSEGGLFFTVKKTEVGEVKTGERITLHDLRGPESQHISGQISMEIKWVSDDALLENIGFGCEFIDLPRLSQLLIRDLIANAPLARRG